MVSLLKESMHYVYVFVTRIYAKKHSHSRVLCCEILGMCLVLAWLSGVKKQQILKISSASVVHSR